MAREEIEVDVNIHGQAWSGRYAIQSDMLTVWMPLMGSRTVKLNDRFEAEVVAKELLAELVRDCRRFGWAASSNGFRQVL